MPRLIQKGSTDITLYFFIVDSADGSPETGITITDLDLQYVRFGATPAAKVDATALAATNSAHADNKAIEVDGTDQPGLYRVDWPDAAFATGVDGVVLTVKGTGFHPAHMEIQLVDFDPTDAVRLGLTALPNAIPGAAGGLLKTDLGRDYDTDLKSSAFAGGMVWVDSAGTASTAWPYGTAPYPTDTIARGKTIADANAITQLRIKGNHTLTAAMETYNLIGGLYLDATEIIDLGGFSVEHSSFRELVITGICGNAALIGDQTTYTDCYLFSVTNIHGWVNGGRIEGTCSIRDTGYATLQNVLFGSGIACTLTLQAPTQCDIENMSGELTLAGMDGGVCSISMARGSLLTIDNTCTAGTITVTGAGIVTDNNGGSTVTVKVNEADLVELGGVAQSMIDLKDFADAGYDPATNKVEGVKTVDTTTANTDMRGTDSAATAAKLLAYVRLLARSDAAVETDAAAELTAINADEGAGAGDFSSQTDSGEAIRDVAPHGSAMVGTNGANTTVPDAAGVVGALIAALENLSQAQAQTAAAAALTAYDPPTRAELTTDTNSIIAEVDANETKIDAVQTDLGDFSGRVNNQSLLAVLGVPDVAGKDLHTLLVTDRLDNGTYGLEAIETLVDELETRLTAARAGYLDELAAANIPADIDVLLARLTAVRAGYLDNLNGHTPQTGDSFARLGAPAGASVSADVAAVKVDTANIETDTQNIQSRIPAALVGGRMDSDIGNIQNNAITAASINTDAIDADAIANDAVVEIQSGLSTHSAADVDTVLTGTHGAGSWAPGAAAPTAVENRQEMDANSTQLAAIVADTGELQADWANGGRLDLLLDQIITDIAASELTPAQVNAEMLDVLNVDTFAEPGQGTPPATASVITKLNYVYKAFRNKLETTSTEVRIFNDAGAVVDQKASLSDDGTTFTRGEFGTGP